MYRGNSSKHTYNTYLWFWSIFVNWLTMKKTWTCTGSKIHHHFYYKKIICIFELAMKTTVWIISSHTPFIISIQKSKVTFLHSRSAHFVHTCTLSYFPPFFKCKILEHFALPLFLELGKQAISFFSDIAGQEISQKSKSMSLKKIFIIQQPHKQSESPYCLYQQQAT